MGKVSYCDCVLLLNVGEEWPSIVDLEVKNTMLIWQLEACSVCLRIRCGSGWFEDKAMEWRKHGEF